MGHGLCGALVAVKENEPTWIDLVDRVHRLAEHVDEVFLGERRLVYEIEAQFAVRDALVAAGKLAPDAFERLERHGIARHGNRSPLRRIGDLARRAVEAEIDVDSVFAPVLDCRIDLFKTVLEPMLPVVRRDEEAVVDRQTREVES